MKLRKPAWIAAICLSSALAITVAVTSRTSSVHAARHADQVKQSALSQPAAYISGPSLRAAFAADSMLLASVSSQRVSAPISNPILPDVEEFTLTPPNPAQGINQTILAVQFPEVAAEKLASQMPMALAGQPVLLKRSVDDPSIFSTVVNFDWTGFLKQQQQREELASEGRTVPIYKGRGFVRNERMQFVDPSEIENALRTHQSIQFTSDVLLGGTGANVVPDHELMIINKSVVEDLESGAFGRTYDACLSGNKGNINGAWTFKTLWTAAINASTTQAAEQALDDMLYNWQNQGLMINNLPVSSRPGIGTLPSPSNPAGTGFLANWPVDMTNMCSEPNGQTYCPSLNAPVRLNAIVNRVDLGGQNLQTPAGELRFVFGVTAGNAPNQSCFSENNGQQPSSGPPFNIIFEYHVPQSVFPTAASWAQQWDSLPKDNFSYSNCLADGCYVPALQSKITDMVVKSNSCNGSTCLFHIRTNEFLLSGTPAVWELREFGVNFGSPNSVSEITMDQTPSDKFNFGGGACFRGGVNQNGEPACTPDTTATVNYLNAHQDEIDSSKGQMPLIPQDIDGFSFQVGSSLNAFENPPPSIAFSYWNVCAFGIDQNCNVHLQTSAYNARRFFSANTCNGCHGFETNNTLFQQVFNRLPGQMSSLSNFLLGCIPTNSQSCTGNIPNTDSCAVGSSAQCPLNAPGQEQVPDPANAQNGNPPFNYGDILARQVNMQTLLGQGNPVFLPFIRPRVGVH